MRPAERLLKQMSRDGVGRPRRSVGKREHIAELENWPLPAAGFPANDGQRGEALHRKCEEDQ